MPMKATGIKLMDDLNGVPIFLQSCECIHAFIITSLNIRTVTILLVVPTRMLEGTRDGASNGQGELNSRIQGSHHCRRPASTRQAHHDDTLITKLFNCIVDG